jgi:ubiquitin carboxyl-terminal hydrolase 34
VSDAANVLNDPEGSHRQYIETSEQIVDLGYNFYKIMSAGLIPIIEKHVTFLSPDAALAHILGLTNILYYSLAFNGCPAHELLESHRMRHPALPEVYSAVVISNEWKCSSGLSG